MRGQTVWVVMLVGFGTAVGASAQAAAPGIPAARLIAADTLSDIAVTTRDAWGPATILVCLPHEGPAIESAAP